MADHARKTLDIGCKPRFTANGADEKVDGKVVEFGAAWKRKSERGDFLSVAIDDPALPTTLNAALFPNGDTATLVWNRLKRKPAGTAE